MARAIARAVAFGVLASACSAPAPLPELAAAERQARAGDVDQALASYRAAQVSCTGIRIARRRREACGQALVGEAELLVDAGRVDEAITAYAAIPDKVDHDPPPSATGLFRAGVLRLARAEATTPPDAAEEKAAWTLLWQVVTDYPDEAFAGDAVERLLHDGLDRDARALFAQFSSVMSV
ncbi:MAG: hypothetical protein K8W52_40735, partial [Deltaproteobacteria bacterium]|nr:hypothetical protein [Deltaproteobacteria bacterium]